MRKYINRRDARYRETVDELDSTEFPSNREFYAECRRPLREYRMADRAADYTASSRACRGWRD
jgi:hypothetical protein